MTGLAWRMVSPADAEDVVQEALAAAWRQRAQYDSARGSARTWLLVLTADHARRAQRRSRRRPDPLEDVAAVALTVHDKIPDLDLRAAIAQLPDRQRLAVELFYYLGLPVTQVAEVMGCAEGTVKSTLFDARRRLRDWLEAPDDDR